MKTIDYACERYGQDMLLLCFVGKKTCEHDCEALKCGGENENTGNEKKRYVEYSEESDGEIDRPKEDEEHEQSEDERHESDNETIIVSGDGHMVDENMAGAGDEHMVKDNVVGGGDEPLVQENVAGARVEPQADVGDEVVLDAGDGGNDGRFTDVFEEGLKAKPGKEAYRNFEEQEAAKREVEESEEECVIEEDAEYPYTPLESDEEWEQLNNDKEFKEKMKDKKKSKFHGDLEKEPYIWLFQKFNSGLEFKDQLLQYSLKTQYDVKMAKSEANMIDVICCDENYKFKFLCSYKMPINKWMVKVYHMKHNHGKTSRFQCGSKVLLLGCLEKREEEILAYKQHRSKMQ
ncbi:hypothetical protein V5N11_035291 [Cardamine amara subsp. amara]|uniref:Transposase MuDR plant domain-containing protein n=1 Tax=Cardamine amara subsp. amara TaxID=228776 RepID=A0ABD0ZNF8_CARAN